MTIKIHRITLLIAAVMTASLLGANSPEPLTVSPSKRSRWRLASGRLTDVRI